MNELSSDGAAEAPVAGARGGPASRWDRLNGPARVPGVDLARGLAVLGMLAAHLITIERLVWTDPSTWAGIVQGRSSILFATLAGVSIGLVTGGRTPYQGERMTTARLRLVIRAGLLWVLGVLLIATGAPVVVILPAYAILFLLAIPFTRLSARTLFLIAAGCVFATPVVVAAVDSLPIWEGDDGTFLELFLGWHYPFASWITFVLAGLGAARAGLRRTRVQVWLVVAGTALAVVAGALDTLTGVDEPDTTDVWDVLWTARPHSGGVLEILGSGGFALAILGACLLLCRTVVVWIVLPLRAVGSMPLSAYAAQILVWAAVSAVVLGDPGRLFAFRALDPFPPFAIGTIVACTAWALLIGRGPFEWMTDRIARGMVPGPGPGPYDERR
ncbi:heparan-alpha-glucosaminide N-acetyltransferase domain-containing protein [Microbacterium sp. NPDC019599]|uniref:heparan-alpha-glucosaminide N-acetyltransferase domain-containing protein n=1 Tax=Microbacterium sp. NPDC019599 TaxID=3154690 RepID=UPI0033ECE065